ncbi:MAG: hypothetical protein SFZ24_04460 [Planctomycetota bacterium]|nr:hypothetical protein [Planctomycetota bacterium]
MSDLIGYRNVDFMWGEKKLNTRRVLGAALLLALASSPHHAQGQIEQVSFNARTRAEHLGGEGQRFEQGLHWGWNTAGERDSLRTAVFSQGNEFAAGEAGATSIESSNHFARFGFDAYASAFALNFDPADPGALSTSSDASAFATCSFACTLREPGRMVIRGSGFADLISFGEGRAEWSFALVALDAQGRFIDERVLAGGPGAWTMDVEVEMPAGAAFVAMEWRSDALGELAVEASEALLHGEISLHVLPGGVPACAGDADAGGLVDFADINAVLAAFGSNYGGLPAAGDADLSGAVDFNDIVTVLRNFGVPCDNAADQS